jgi:uncharacterized protein (UPF0128 family)
VKISEVLHTAVATPAAQEKEAKRRKRMKNLRDWGFVV